MWRDAKQNNRPPASRRGTVSFLTHTYTLAYLLILIGECCVDKRLHNNNYDR